MFLGRYSTTFAINHIRFSAIRERRQEMLKASRITIRKRKGTFDKSRYALAGTEDDYTL